jgi:hypothetical protein
MGVPSIVARSGKSEWPIDGDGGIWPIENVIEIDVEDRVRKDS